MFRKLVANLSFSPALIHEIGFYAHRLRKEEATRQLTIVFTVLALVVQSLVIFSPTESANASSSQDLIRGGISSKEDFLARYDANEVNIKDIFTTAGISRDEINTIQAGTVSSHDDVLVMGRDAEFGSAQGEVPFSYTKTDDGQTGTAYIAPLHLWDTSSGAPTYQAWIGKSASLGWFAILKNCGNLVTKTLPNGALKPSSAIKEQISAVNLTQGAIQATSTTAHASDLLSYTIIAKNSGSTPQLVPLTVPLSDILEYATITDNGGAVVDNETQTLAWPPISLAPGKTQQRTFVVQVRSPIPATGTGQSNGTSYDCILNGSFGTTSNIRIDCPVAKVVESTTNSLPTLGLFENIVFASMLSAIVVYFYLRTKQLKKEIRIIRHTLNTGTL